MSGSQNFGAGTPTTFLDTDDTDLDTGLGYPAYFGGQIQHGIYGQTTSFGRHPTAFMNQNGNNWQLDSYNTQPAFRQQHLSVSTQSSGFSDYRSSGSSFFSDQDNRFSAISNNSTWSSNSAASAEHFAFADEHLTVTSPTTTPYGNCNPEVAYVQTAKRRTTPRIPQQDKDPYKTCVSRPRQRTRRSTTIQRYFCTACCEPFSHKADWKRHEEEYQERPEEFKCDNCYKIYFLDKNFVVHHKSNHGCIPCAEVQPKCSEKKHVQLARRSRQTRTGWGCGFCYHFSDNWTDRCNHIADHFDHEHKTMSDWKHSSVIYSLLLRPEILPKWEAILQSKGRVFVGFDWDPQRTGRVEGYPESNRTLQLQDALEYFIPEQGAATMAKWAFDQAAVKVARVQPQAIPPPVPPKDYRLNHKASLQDIMKEPQDWNHFIRSIIHDEMLPVGVTSLENIDSSLDEQSQSWFDAAH